MRWGLGPVFAWEWSRTSRRWQTYALRSVVVALLLATLAGKWFSVPEEVRELYLSNSATLGPLFYSILVDTQLTLILLIAPVATAGAICEDKPRGVLLHLLATDLSAVEIVLGKLAARMIPVLGLLLCSLPVLAICSLLGGIDPSAVLVAYLVMAAVAVLGGALALTLSVWGRRTYHVLLLTYAVGIGCYLLSLALANLGAWFSSGLSGVLAWANPFWIAWLPYLSPGSSNVAPAAVYLTVCVLLALALVGVSAACLRRVVGNEKAPGPPSSFWQTLLSPHRWWPVRWGISPLLDVNPVLWLGWRPRRLSVAWGLYIVCVGLALRSTTDSLAPWVNGILVSAGLLLVAVGAVTSVTEDREHGTLDVLLSTPLPTYTIVFGKWWAAYRNVVPLALLAALVLVARGRGAGSLVGVAAMVGYVLTAGAAVTSLGLTLATLVRKPGRALALTVALYAGVALGLPGAKQFSPMGMESTFVAAMASPLFAVGVLTADVGNSRLEGQNLGATGLWSGVYFSAAVALLQLTIAVFGRCHGRIEANAFPPTGGPTATCTPPPRRIG